MPAQVLSQVPKSTIQDFCSLLAQVPSQVPRYLSQLSQLQVPKSAIQDFCSLPAQVPSQVPRYLSQLSQLQVPKSVYNPGFVLVASPGT